jgi:hypothetical protein
MQGDEGVKPISATEKKRCTYLLIFVRCFILSLQNGNTFLWKRYFSCTKYLFKLTRFCHKVNLGGKRWMIQNAFIFVRMLLVGLS